MDPTRAAAFALLTAVLERRRTLDDALASLPPYDERDRAAGHRLAAAVLRRAASLDAVLDRFLARSPPPPVRLILRLGAAGLLLLGTPPHAAVATSVDLVRASGRTPFAGMVNAVLRKVASEGPALLATLDGPRLDTPSWLWKSWGSDAAAIAAAHQTPLLLAAGAPLDLTLRPGTPPPPGAELLPTGSARLPAGTAVAGLAGFGQGQFWVQDAAAALPAHLLAPRPGERIVDLCAAPGGKTAQLAAAGAVVTALDRDGARLGLLRANLERLGFEATLVQADAQAWQPDATFDAVLLDAPCSATGTIRRHPDVPYLKRPRDVAALAAAQARLAAAAAALLRPGGRLIYAVCSLQPEETGIAAAFEQAGLRADPFTTQELAMLPEARTADGNLRTHPALWPERGGMDGFFAARFRRP